METAEYQEIIIDWTELKSLEESLELNEFVKVKVEEKNKNVVKQEYLKNEKHFIYQIYGDHHIYGRDVLLYIGISKDIVGRFSTHLNGVFGYVNDKKISVGLLNEKDIATNVKEVKDLEKIESILIANHKPAFNKEYIHNVHSSAQTHKIIVINNGSHGMLKNACTNFWWVNGKNVSVSE